MSLLGVLQVEENKEPLQNVVVSTGTEVRLWGQPWLASPAEKKQHLVLRNTVATSDLPKRAKEVLEQVMTKHDRLMEDCLTHGGAVQQFANNRAVELEEATAALLLHRQRVQEMTDLLDTPEWEVEYRELTTVTELSLVPGETVVGDGVRVTWFPVVAERGPVKARHTTTQESSAEGCVVRVPNVLKAGVRGVGLTQWEVKLPELVWQQGGKVYVQSESGVYVRDRGTEWLLPNIFDEYTAVALDPEDRQQLWLTDGLRVFRGNLQLGRHPALDVQAEYLLKLEYGVMSYRKRCLLAVDRDRIYVCLADVLVVLDRHKNYKCLFSVEVPGCSGLAVHPDGRIFTAGRDHAVLVVNSEGRTTQVWGESGKGRRQFLDIGGLAVGGAYLYVADTRNQRIQALLCENGKFIHQWKTEACPTGLSYIDGRLYVSQARRGLVTMFA
jgi:hypothetical protein